MSGSEATIDLDAFGLRPGEAEQLEVPLRPDPPVLGGVPLSTGAEPIATTIDISRTSSGYALRLRANATVGGECARCLAPAERRLSLEVREVDQGGESLDGSDDVVDSELRSPYVSEGRLDALAWLHDALMLALPERLLCRSDCAGLCPVCGESLNDADPAEHRHERPLDPRFAKLRELER